MKKLRLLDLFSGIGGFSLGLERSGYFETVAFCEIEPFPRRVLAKHWPEVPCYEDVRTLTADRLAADGIAVDAICGGFPCQDLSVAGKRGGIDAERSGLWSEYARLIGELRPSVVIVENVTGLLSGPSERPGGWFGRVLGDLAAVGYDAEWHCIPAFAVGAPHSRDRVWVVSYPHEDGLQEREHVAGLSRKAASRQQAWSSSNRVPAPAIAPHPDEGEFSLGRAVGRMGRIVKSVPRNRDWPLEAEPVLGRGADGLPDRLDRLGALGNAVVPQIPELIGRAIGQALEASQQREAA